MSQIVEKYHGQAVIEKALLIVHGPGEGHWQYDRARQIVSETSGRYLELLQNEMYRAGLLYRDLTTGEYRTSSKGIAALEAIGRVGNAVH